MKLFAGTFAPQKQLIDIRHLLLCGQVSYLLARQLGHKTHPKAREDFLLKYAMRMVDQCDLQAQKLVMGMIRTAGMKYPKTTNPAPLCLWDYWFELVHGEHNMQPEQYRMPLAMRELLKKEFNDSGLAVISTHNNVRL